MPENPEATQATYGYPKQVVFTDSDGRQHEMTILRDPKQAAVDFLSEQHRQLAEWDENTGELVQVKGARLTQNGEAILRSVQISDSTE